MSDPHSAHGEAAPKRDPIVRAYPLQTHEMVDRIGSGKARQVNVRFAEHPSNRLDELLPWNWAKSVIKQAA